MAKAAKKRLCASIGCGRKFQPKVNTHLYCSHECKNRASQARLRMRAKRATRQIEERRMEERPYGD